MMRFFITTFFTFLLIVSGVSAAPTTTLAQECVDDAGVPCEVLTPPSTPPIGTVSDDTVAPLKLGDNSGIMIFIMGLFAWLLGIAAITLDAAVYYTVLTMGSYIKDLSAIGITWTILRDIGNIVLIFGFLLAGVNIILGTHFYGEGQKLIPVLIIVAVSLNFSLFVAEAVIDTGNLFATQVYSAINKGEPAGLLTNNLIRNPSEAGSQGVGGIIMAQLGLQTIYGAGMTNPAIFEGSTPVFVAFMAIILFLVTAFVLFSLAFILVARFVILILVIITSPIGFIGYAIPPMKAKADLWWHTLFSQTLTAPVLMLSLYVALSVITSPKFFSGFKGSGLDHGIDSWTNLATEPAGFGGMVVAFLVAMGLLLAVNMMAKELSAFGASGAMKLAGRASFGAASLGARVTLGSAGNLLASKRMQSWARSGGIGGGLLKATVFAGQGLRSATYDVRNYGGKRALGALGIDVGEGATFTAKDAHDAQYGVKPVKKFFKAAEEEREHAGREMDFKDAQANLAAGVITRARHDAIVAPILSKMNTKQLEELGGIKKGVEALVNNLSPQQFESLMKSDKLSDAEKDKIKDARYRNLADAVGVGSIPDIKKAVNAFSKGELESMPAALLGDSNVLAALSDKQRDTITDSKERTAAEKDKVRGASPTGSIEESFDVAGGGTAGAAAVAASISGLTAPQAAKLKKDILREPLVAERLTGAMLVELQEQKKLTGSEMVDIGNAIRASRTASTAVKDYVTTGPAAALWS